MPPLHLNKNIQQTATPCFMAVLLHILFYKLASAGSFQQIPNTLSLAYFFGFTRNYSDFMKYYSKQPKDNIKNSNHLDLLP